jgi:hypothetical protein
MNDCILRFCYAATPLLLAALLLVPSAAAQTALLDTPLFHLNDDGSLVSLGTFGVGTIPASGLGTRLMWHPKKAAFRDGFVDAAQWDEANVGDYSVALGAGTTASGLVSTALGFHTTASGLNAVAIGTSTTAQAYASLVLGRYNIIAGNPTSWTGSDPVLVVGNGSNSSNRSNALTLLQSGTMFIAGTLFENSDRRLKRDIQPLRDALAGVRRLQAVRYRFRESANRAEGAHIGLVAQEVATVFPELVQEEANGLLSVSYSKLTAVLVQALNEQQTQIERLQDRLARLEALLAGAGDR